MNNFHHMKIQINHTIYLIFSPYNISIADLDNLVKFVLDALNAKAYEDDSQIAVIKSAKFYTLGEPYTKIILRKLSETDYEDFKF
jgi:Holliday junction resolvase RusA-like endonuclease